MSDGLVPVGKALQQIQQAVTNAEQALDKVSDLAGALRVQKGAETLRVMCAQADADLLLQNYATEVRLGAEAKAGAMLDVIAAQRRQPGKRTDLTSRHDDGKLTYGQTIKKHKLPEPTARRYRNVAKVKPADLAAHIKKVNEERIELTTTSVLKLKPRNPSDTITRGRSRDIHDAKAKHSVPWEIFFKSACRRQGVVGMLNTIHKHLGKKSMTDTVIAIIERAYAKTR